MNQAKLQLIILDALLAFEQDQAQSTKQLAAIITQAIIDAQERLNQKESCKADADQLRKDIVKFGFSKEFQGVTLSNVNIGEALIRVVTPENTDQARQIMDGIREKFIECKEWDGCLNQQKDTER